MKIEVAKNLFFLNEEEKVKNQNRGTDKALIQPVGCGAKLKWDEMEDVTEKVLRQLKEINDNYNNAVIDVSKEINVNI